MNIENMSEVRLPFAGFYYSIWDDLIEREIEWELDDKAQKPESLNNAQLQDYSQWIYDNADFASARRDICREYASAFVDKIAEMIGAKEIPYWFVSMNSPREYNFTTDKLYVKIPLEALEKLLQVESVKVKLPDMVKSQHSSRSGFISFYSNDLTEGEWAKPIEEWDCNQWHTVLLCMFDDKGMYSYEAWEMEVYEHFAGNGIGSVSCDYEEWQKTQGLESEQQEKLEAVINGLLKTEYKDTFIVKDYISKVAKNIDSLELSYIHCASGNYEAIELDQFFN